MAELTHFEQESTKIPVVLPLVGIGIFILIAFLAILFPGGAQLHDKYKGKDDKSESSSAAAPALDELEDE